MLKVFLSDERVCARVLFGTDFYMIEQELFRERYLALRLRALLGEACFRQIAETNPRKWLGEAREPSVQRWTSPDIPRSAASMRSGA